MIVVDVNVVAYLYLPSEGSAASEALLLREPNWIAPRLWRSEFNNILATFMRQGLLSLDDAMAVQRRAHALLAGSEYDVPASASLRLAHASGCSAYDCEYIALAEHLDLRLVTADRKLCRAFPARAKMLSP